MKNSYIIPIFFLLFLLSYSAFAQIKKGDVWLDFSQQNFQQNSKTVFIETFGFISNSSSFQSRMGYGKFIGNNTLFGFKVNANGIIDRDIFFFGQHPSEIDIGLFVKSYFRQESLRFFAETSVNTEFFTGRNIFNLLSLQMSEYVNWKIGGGLAYFLNERTSLELSYNFKPLALTENGSQFFPKKLAPDFGIGLRYFILKNREGIQNLNAAKTLKKGTLSVNLDSDFRLGKQQKIRQTKLSIEYYIRKNFQLKAAFGSNHKNFTFTFVDFTEEEISENLSDAKDNYFGEISGLYFFKLNKKLSLDPGIGMRVLRSPNIGNGFFGTEEKIFFLEENIDFRLGLSFYWGRHLLRPYFLYQLSSYDNNAPNTELINFSSFSFNLDYELFLAENLSMNIGANYAPNYQWIEPKNSTNGFLIFAQEKANIARINFGFKWYLRRGKN